MVCHDDHLLSGGRGFADHSHADLEIVTWVLRGTLTHADSSSPAGSVGPGSVQVLSAGSGVRLAHRLPVSVFRRLLGGVTLISVAVLIARALG
jgi:redox-sensitive bicupin YhaK (pirin superfamily)